MREWEERREEELTGEEGEGDEVEERWSGGEE